MNLRNLSEALMMFGPYHSSGNAASSYFEGKQQAEENVFKKYLQQQQLKMQMEQAAREQERFGQEKGGWATENLKNAFMGKQYAPGGPMEQETELNLSGKRLDNTKKQQVADAWDEYGKAADKLKAEAEQAKSQLEIKESKVALPDVEKLHKLKMAGEGLKLDAQRANIRQSDAAAGASGASAAHSGVLTKLAKKKLESVEEDLGIEKGAVMAEFQGSLRDFMKTNRRAPSEPEKNLLMSKAKKKLAQPEITPFQQEEINVKNANTGINAAKMFMNTLFGKQKTGKPVTELSMKLDAVKSKEADVKMKRLEFEEVAAKYGPVKIQEAWEKAKEEVKSRWNVGWMRDKGTGAVIKQFIKNLVDTGVDPEDAKKLADGAVSQVTEQDMTEGED